jgi:DNA topoisomerase I
MPKYLVVVESPAKAKTINKFLGPNYSVKACFGAVRDLPKSSLGVDVDNNFEPKYVNLREETNRKALKDIKDRAAKVDEILIASDPDREGEAIAWHVAEILKNFKKTADKPTSRIVFNEITKDNVKKAVKNPREVDFNLVDAQQARRVIDRLVGYKISPLLGWVVRKGLSAGRVQSVTVRMVVDRENEIRAFVPEEYWSMDADFSTPRADTFTARLHSRNGESIAVGKPGQIKSQEEADAVLAALNNADYTVGSVKRKEVKRRPSPPFITSTLQQDASRKLGMSTAQTMAIAQQLYQGINIGAEGQVGLITYMRTDSLRLSDEALNSARSYIKDTFGDEMLPAKPNVYRNKKNAQDAHEAIRPTSAFHTPEKLAKYLKEDQRKLYMLIWKRFIASQMPPAVLDQTTVDIPVNEFLFRATGSIMKFQGFTKLYQESRDEDENGNDASGLLPDINEAEALGLNALKPDQHFTKPPPRYSEASLVRAMEENGIGRPSTYAPTIRTILSRMYVEKVSGRLVPTELGEEVNKWL